MSNYAVVTAGTVTNIIVWDGAVNEHGAATWSPPEGSNAVLVEDGVEAQIGYTYDGTNFAPPSSN